MSSFTDRVAELCLEELARWGNGQGRETDSPYYRFVAEYWSIGVHNAHINGRTEFQDSEGRKFRPAWSSAFVSYIYRRAHAGAEFFYHEGHIHYVVKALRDAADGNTAKFLGRDPVTYQPGVGDLINAGRGRGRAVSFSNVLRKYGSAGVPYGRFIPSHSDIVVSVDSANGILRTVGGNVETDTVGEKQWTLNPNGTLQDGPSLICVIECAM